MTLGVILSLITAILWAISPLCFASAARRAGPIPVNLMRIALSAFVLTVTLPFHYTLLPVNLAWPTTSQLAWLTLSGLLGIAIGDLLMYQSLVTLGPRRTTQLFTLQPVSAVALGYLAGESLSPQVLFGIVVTITATTIALFARPSLQPTTEPGRLTKFGLACGTLAAIFNGFGAVAGRQAFRTGPDLDPFLATTLRVLASTAILWTIPLLRGNARQIFAILRHPGVPLRLLSGTAVGPILGMLCYVTALKHAPAGLVSTIISTSPLLVLPYITVRYRVRLGIVTPIAAAVACGGVALITSPGAILWLSRVLSFARAH